MWILIVNFKNVTPAFGSFFLIFWFLSILNIKNFNMWPFDCIICLYCQQLKISSKDSNFPSSLNFSWIKRKHLVRTRCITTFKTLVVCFGFFFFLSSIFQQLFKEWKQSLQHRILIIISLMLFSDMAMLLCFSWYSLWIILAF